MQVFIEFIENCIWIAVDRPFATSYVSIYVDEKKCFAHMFISTVYINWKRL